MAGSNAAGSFGPFVDRTWSSSLYSDRPDVVDRPSVAPMPARTSVPGWRSPFHPAHAVASVPLVAHHYPHQAYSRPVPLPYDKTRSAASDLNDSRLCWIDPIRGSVPPGNPHCLQNRRSYRFLKCQTCLRGSGSRFSAKRKPIASFPEMERNEHHAHHT